MTFYDCKCLMYYWRKTSSLLRNPHCLYRTALIHSTCSSSLQSL